MIPPIAFNNTVRITTRVVSGSIKDKAGKCPRPNKIAASMFAIQKIVVVGLLSDVLLINDPSQANKDITNKRSRISSAMPP